jgi:hypothetical protein
VEPNVARISLLRLGKNAGLSGCEAAGPDECRDLNYFSANRGLKSYSAQQGCDDDGEKNGAIGDPLGEVGEEAVEPDDGEDAGEVVGERHQAPFAADLVEAAHQEMAVAGAAFEGAERMLGEAGATAHQRAGILHPLSMAFENVFVLPAMDGARRQLVGDAALAQRAGVARRFAAHVTNLDPAAGVAFAARRRRQQRTARTAVGVRAGIVGEVVVAEAALRRETPRPHGLRHIGDDAIVLTVLQRGAVVVSDVGECLERLGAKCLLGGLRHLVQTDRCRCRR